jgi:hypothetical protein
LHPAPSPWHAARGLPADVTGLPNDGADETVINAYIQNEAQEDKRMDDLFDR